MEHKTWKRCAVCGLYFFTDAVRCTNYEQHEQPAPLLVISDRQFARVTAVLEAVRKNLPARRREAFGLFVLGLEEVNNRPCRSDIALALFEQRESWQAEQAERTGES